MGFLRRRAERKFYKSLDEQHPLVAGAAIEFFSTLKDLDADPNDKVPEPVRVSVAFAHDAPRPAADLCLVGQYVTKVSYNLYGSPPYDLFWSEMWDCSGDWGKRAGPPHLQVVSAKPKEPTRVYRAKLYETPNGWVEFTPYDGKGGEGYYAPMSAFALIRVVRSGMSNGVDKLDEMLDLLAGRSDSLMYPPDDSLAQVERVHDTMQEVGVHDPRQLPPEDG